MSNKRSDLSALYSVPVIVAALGYFVDIYDLLLFTQVRIDSLRDLGLDKKAISEVGASLLNDQMIGLLIGGVLWGVLGDKRGRLSVLFGSILLYSVANIVNGFVTTTTQYAICRFIAGIGLAGELGAGITLVSELTSKEIRGIVTSFVAGVGLLGAIFAYFIKQLVSWRYCFFLGGGLGLMLLLMRVSVFESGMYKSLAEHDVKRGDLLHFFSNWNRTKKYILSILIGIPVWYVIGILIAFSNDFATDFRLTDKVDPARAIMMAYIGLSVGDVLIGLVSQLLRSRKKAMFVFYTFTAIGLWLFFNQDGGTPSGMYARCMWLGFSIGFWAIFVTMAAEQFGTNLRSTAATTVPNVVRGTLPLLTWVKGILVPHFGGVQSAIYLGIGVMMIAAASLFALDETFGKELDYVDR